MSSLSSSTNNHQTPSTSTQPSAPPLPQYSGLKTPSTSTSSSSSHQMALLNLNSINNNKSVLLVNVKELNLRVYNEIIVSWNILEATSMHDWIGLFKTETPIADDTSYLDIQRVNGAKIGHVSWSLGKLKSLQFGSALKPDDLVEFRYHTSVNLRPCGAVLACSIALPIRLQTTAADSAIMANSSLNQSSPITPSSNTSLNTSSSSSSLLNLNRFSSSLLAPPSNRDDEFITFRISDIKGAQLRKGVFFNPDPYVKISIVTSNGSSKASNSNDTSNSVSFNNHSANINIGNSSSNPTRSSLIYGHSREFKTFAATNTCFPNWKNENFVLVARLNDLISLEVKDKFARTKPSINRFLGRVLVDVNQLVEKVKLNKGKYHFTFDLTKRTNSDTNITGSLSFTFSTFSATSNKFQSNSAPPLSNNNNTSPSVSQPGKSNHHNHHNHHHQSLTSSPSTPLISNNANNTIAAVNINNNNSLSSLKSNHSTQSSPPPVTSQTQEEASSSSQLSQCLFALEINSSENSLNNLPPPLEESQSPAQSSKKAADQASGPTTAAVSSASSSSSSTTQDEPKKQQTYSSSSSSSSRSTSSDETAINEETQHLDHRNIQQEEEEENNENDIDIEEEFAAPNGQQQQQQQSNPTQSSDLIAHHNHHHQILPSSSSSSSSSSNSSANSSLSNSISNLVNSPSAATNQPAVSSTVVTTNDNRLSSLKKTVLRKKFNESRSKSLDQLKQSSSSARSKSLSNPNVNSQVSTPKIDTNSSLVTCQTTPIATATTKRANLYLKRNESADNKSSPVSVLTSNLCESNRITQTIVVDEPPVSRESELEKAKRSINNAVRIGEKEECKKRRDEEEQDAECSSSRISATSSSSSNQATACRPNHHMIEEEEQPKEQEETRRSSEEAASSSSKMPCTTGGDPLVTVESPSTSSSSSSSSPMEASTHLEPVTKLIETSENSATATAAAVKPSEVKPSATSSRKSNKLVDQQHLTVIDSNVASELPPLWEARVDHLGRVFYIDHINRTTTWKKPRMATINTSGAGTTSASSNGSTPRDQQQHHSYELEKQRLDKRYQSIRRTISNNHDAESVYSNKAKQVKTGSNPTTSVVSEGASSSSGVGVSTSSSSSSSSLATVVAASSSVSATGTSGAAASIEPEESSTSSIAAGSALVAPEAASSSDPLLEQPGAQFILRADLLAVIRKNPEAKELVKSSSSLATILQRVRTNPSYYYKKYQHNKDLVRFLNLFAMRDEPMPPGWEIKCEFEKSDKVFFVDHNSRSTTFIDPRLPLPKPSNSNTHITTITTISPPSTLQRNATNSSTPTTTSPTATEEVAETTPTATSSTSSSQSQRASDWASIKVPTTNTHHHHHNHQESATTPSGSSSSSKKTSSSVLITPGVLQPPAFPPPPPPALPPSLPPPPQQQQQSTITTATSSSSSSSTSSSYRASPHVATAVVAASAPPPPAAEPVHFSSHQQPSTATTTQSAAGISNNSNISYADRVVAFVQQANLFDVLKKNNIQLTSKQREKLNLVRQSGRSVYDRMSGDIDMASVVSQLEEMIMSFVVLGSSKTSSSSSSSSSSTDTTATTPVTTTATTEATAQATQPSTSSSSSSNQSSQLGSKNLSYKFPASSSSLNPTTSTSPSNAAVNNNRRDYQRSFQTKLRNFYRKLESKGYGQGPQKSKIMVRRDKLLDDARVKVMQLSKHELRKNKLFICFQGEEGLDYGGPAREFFYLLSRELFNPYYGLFEYSASDMYTVQISSMSTYQDHVLEWFQFAGRVIGVALIHQYLLDAFFTRPFYKALLRDTNWTLSDLETLDPEFCQSLVYVKENDVTGLDFTFSVTENKCGKVIERDLKENGRNITVTEKNKMEYIQRMIKWRVERDVQKQTEALVRGFLDVVDPKHVQLFDARELELVLCGTVEIDVADWKKHTDYRSGYHAQHPVIQWFWQAVDRFDNEQKLKLLQFVTGTSSIPHEGFAALRGSNGPRKFCIERWGTLDALPRAHTCFNRLDLPPYSSFDVLYEKLLLAIEETSGFCIQ